MTAIRLARARDRPRGRDQVRRRLPRALRRPARGRPARGSRRRASPRAPASRPRPPRRPSSCPGTTPAALARRLERHAVAAIIAEPLPGEHGRSSPPREGFLELLREQRRRVRRAADLRRGDQRLSRRARRRQRAHRRDRATSSCSARSSAAGCRRRRSAGPRELLELLAPVGEVYQAGTLSGNPLAVAAGLATLALLDDAAYATLAAAHAAARRGPARRRRAGAPVSVAWAPGPADGVLRRRAARATSPSAQRCDLAAHAAWCRELLARGVYPPPSQFEAWFPSLAHGAEQIERTRGRRRARRSTRCRARGGGDERARAAARAGRRRGRAAAPARLLDGARRRAASRRRRDRRRAARGRGARAGRVRAADRGDLRGLPAPLRRLAARLRQPTPTSRCSPATASTRSGSSGSSRSATSTRCASSPT